MATHYGAGVKDEKHRVCTKQNPSKRLVRVAVLQMKTVSCSCLHFSLRLRKLANDIFMSKLLYGAETWAGAPKFIIKRIQHIQLEAATTIIGPKSTRWSTTSLLKEMKWLGVPQIAQLWSAKLTHSILLSNQPEVLSHRITSKMTHSRTIT